jgi:hypothetical protein
MKFTIDDIKNKELLCELVEYEAKGIYENPKTRKERSYEHVRSSVLQGKVAEVYLIETGNYKKSERKYHDVVDKNGREIEVKAYANASVFSSEVKKDLERLEKANWNQSEWYFLFSYDSGTYELVAKLKIRRNLTSNFNKIQYV